MRHITANKYALRWSAKPPTPPNNFFPLYYYPHQHMLQWMEWSAARAAMGVKEAARPDHRSIGSNLFIPPLLLWHFLHASLLPASINRAIDEETDCGWNIFLCNAKSFVPHHTTTTTTLCTSSSLWSWVDHIPATVSPLLLHAFATHWHTA